MSMLLVKNKKNIDYDKMKQELEGFFFKNIIENKPIKNKNIDDIYKMSVASKSFDLVSLSMSYLAINNYKQGATYYQTLNLLNDAKYLANSSNNLLAQKINLFCSSLIEYFEKNIDVALNLMKASLYLKVKEENYDEAIIDYRSKIENEKEGKSISSVPPSFIPSEIKDDAFLALLQVGRTIAVETDIDNLLTIIAKQIQQALDADRCTVFLLDDETNELWSKVALGLESREIRFKANKGLAGHVATTGETVNIKNAYESEYFNKDIDLETGYKTKNILCMPIRNLSHQIVGVFQVLNKNNGDFTQKDEDLLVAIGSSAGIALENANLFNKQKKMIEEQRMLFLGFIDTLAASIDARDKITSGHSKRVMMYSSLICQKCKISEQMQETIRNAALLHDIGKIGIKDSILQKEGKLTSDEYEHIKEHVALTDKILGKIKISKNFKEVTKIASSHHEKYDGTGYFKGLKGEQIPVGGRILAVSDVFDAITSKRHYRNKMEIIDALKIIIEGKNKHFDEKIVNAFMSVSLYDILKVLTSDIEIQFSEDENYLKQHCLADLYEILINKDKIKDEEKLNLSKVFDKYYHHGLKA